MYLYDTFGRLVEVTTNDANEFVVARYRYNGLGFRISSYAESEATTFSFCYDERWRIVATFRGSDSSPKERFVY